MKNVMGALIEQVHSRRRSFRGLSLNEIAGSKYIGNYDCPFFWI